MASAFASLIMKHEKLLRFIFDFTAIGEMQKVCNVLRTTLHFSQEKHL